MIVLLLAAVAAGLALAGYIAEIEALSGVGLVVALGAVALFALAVRRDRRSSGEPTAGGSPADGASTPDTAPGDEPAVTGDAGSEGDGVARPRTSRPGRADDRRPAKSSTPAVGGAKAGTAKAGTAKGGTAKGGDTRTEAMGATAGDDAFVLVVHGKRRYHLEGCPTLDGLDPEEITLGEAHIEGFSACSRCARPQA